MISSSSCCSATIRRRNWSFAHQERFECFLHTNWILLNQVAAEQVCVLAYGLFLSCRFDNAPSAFDLLTFCLGIEQPGGRPSTFNSLFDFMVKAKITDANTQNLKAA